MIRRVLQSRLKDRIKIQETVNKTAVKSVWVAIKKLKWKYGGNAIRETPQKWNRILITWNPHQGQRKRGRPIKKRVDEIQ